MKDTFILRSNYEELFQELSCAQAGEVIKAVFAYANQRDVPAFTDAQSRIVFKCIQKDIAYDLEKYQKTCAKWAANGRKGGRPPKTKITAGLPSENENQKTKQNHHEEMRRDEMRRDHELISTARTENGPAQGTQVLFGEEKKTTTAPVPTPLEQFKQRVLACFEPDVKTPVQQEIWFKRNVRCLKDILQFCGEDIPLALQTIDVCLERLEKSGLTGGYEAVCRNLPEYMARAQEKMEHSAYVC